MTPKLHSLKITKLFGYKNIELPFKDVTVLVGKNGLGKTTILKSLYALLNRKFIITEQFDSAELHFTNGETVSMYKVQPQYNNSFEEDLEIEKLDVYIDELKNALASFRPKQDAENYEAVFGVRGPMERKRTLRM